jgi:hypothetical protein
VSADLCRRQSRLTGWPLWWRSDSGREPAVGSALSASSSSMFHLWKRFAKRKSQPRRGHTREPDPKHLEQKHNGSIQ